MDLWPHHPSSWPWGRHKAQHHKLNPFLLQTPLPTSSLLPPSKALLIGMQNLPPQKALLFGMQSQPRSKIPAAGPCSLHQKAGHTPSHSAPAADGQNCCHLPRPSPWGRRNTTWGLSCQQWPEGLWGRRPAEEGGDRKQAKGSVRQNHTVPQSLSGLHGRRSRLLGWGEGWGWELGAWNQGRMSLRDAASTGEGVTPTTAAKLFQPQPKRNTEKGESQRHGGGQSDRREDDCKWPQC
jgi:hypothetical protein